MHHASVTVDFKHWGERVYELHIPTTLNVQQTIINIAEALYIPLSSRPHQRFALRIVNKSHVMTDTERLDDVHVSNGDYLEIL